MNAPTGIINIRGKEYHTVAKRVADFRDRFADHTLTTSIVEINAEVVIMRAEIAYGGTVIATGHAEEFRKSSQINKTSALENAETSAIGRALAAFGIGGTEFASANEVENAIHQQAAEGQGQGTSQGAVSPPSAKPKNWGGRYPTATALKRAMHEHNAELVRLGNEGSRDDLDTYLTSPEYGDYITQAEEHAKAYLHGGPPAPEEYVSTFALEQRARDMIALRGGRAAEPIEEKENA